MDPDLFYHVYVSSAVKLMPSEELLELLKQCRSNNAKLGLSGILLHKDGNFMQVLEGPELSVQSLLQKIYRDPRHSGVLPLTEGFSKQRQFPDWTMGFRELNSPEVIGTPGFSEFMNLPLTADSFRKDSTRCQRLLHTFKKLQS